jgi:TPR repeat protein
MQKPDFSGVQMASQPQLSQTQPAQQALEAPAVPEKSWEIQRDTSRFAEDVTPAPVPAPAYDAAPVDVGQADDIGTIALPNDKALLQALEETPDKVAMQMNEIAPGANQRIIQEPAPEAEEAAEIETALANVPAQTEAPVAEAAPSPAPPEGASFKVDAPRGNGIPSSVQPDSSLPASMKAIEAQAFKGVPEAQHDLAAIYTAGHAGVRQDYSRAAYWFNQAAGQGVSNAAYNLGVLNHQGLGMKGNMDEAIRWYMKAGEMGHPEAQYNLGIAFIEGIGVPYDPARAARYFENAAGKGIKEAAYNLGLIHENGLLGTPEPDKALVWYKTAADAGSPEAKAALEQLAKTLGLKIEDVNKIAESMKKEASATMLQKETYSQPVSTSPSLIPPVEKADLAPPAAPVRPKATKTAPPIDHAQYEVQEQEQAMVAQIQEYLMRLGLYPGPADGVSGALTSDAIRSYQSLNKLEVNGEVSKEILSHMLANAADGGDWDGNAGDVGSRAE